MRYPNIQPAVFLKRLNRFTAQVLLEDRIETVHVKNTGRLGELLIENAPVMLTRAANPERKTAYDLVTVRKEGLGWVNVDSQAPNALVAEWLQRKPHPFRSMESFRAEVPFGASRIDFAIREREKTHLLEVKGCTLEIDGIGYFPDAPTERGIKHLQELSSACVKGYSCWLAYVIAMPGVQRVKPNIGTHPAYAEALAEAQRSGVHILHLPCRVEEGEIHIIEGGVTIE